MNTVSPIARGTIQPDDQKRLRKALESKAEADVEIRSAVLEAVEHGASVRELAAFTGLSTNTVSRWKRGE